MLPYASESSIGGPPLIDANEVEVALLRNDALAVRAFLDALRDSTVRAHAVTATRRGRQTAAAAVSAAQFRRSGAAESAGVRARMLTAVHVC